MNPHEEIKQFVKERDEAFLSLNEDKIRAMCLKWNDQKMTDDPTMFWAAIHKAITGAKTLPIEFRRKSKQWLDGLGLKSWDDGDL